MPTSLRRRLFAKLLCVCIAVCLTGLAQADTVLITGANSGIGLEFAKEYAAKGWTVIATHRRDQVPATLKDLVGKYPSVRAERMDVTKRDEIHALAVKLHGAPNRRAHQQCGRRHHGRKDGAWRGPGADNKGQTFGTLNYDEFDTFMRTNVAGPSMVTEQFLQNVEASKQKKVIAISSSNGMITGKPLCCGLFWYRLSKAALNKLMISISAAVRKDGVTVVIFNPGAVRVEKQADLEYPGCCRHPLVVADMIKVIARVHDRRQRRFLQHDGTTQPW